MTTINRISVGLLALSAATSIFAADVPSPASAPPPEHTFQRRVFVHPGEGEKENVTFLGVDTTPASPTLAAQLQLPRGAGLVVGQVVPDSPAAKALQSHDILLKLDDQLLIDSRQLSVLIRNHAEGDSVTLTYVRAGKSATVVVKLVKHEVPKFVQFENVGAGDMLPLHAIGEEQGLRGDREQTDHVLRLVGPGPGAPMDVRTFHGRPGPDVGYRGTKVNTRNSNMVYTDPQGTLELTIKDAQKTLVAKNPKGEQVFSGPVTTPEQRKALSPEIRERLDHIEGMDDFSFETDGAFEEGVRTMGAEHRKIILPLRPAGGAPHAMAL